MTTKKTKATTFSPEAYVASIEDDSRRKDCERLMRIMATASKQEARMWGTSIVGFGTHKYQLASGREGEICAVGFSSRKGDISVYGVAGETTDSKLLNKLGKHKLGKGCLYISHLADVDIGVFEELVARALKARQA